MTLKERMAALSGSDILRDLTRLVSGTVGGRLIMLAALPFVTRLYSPADFALLAAYLGLVSLVSVVACLRFDIAIPVAQEEEDAAHLLVLSLAIAGAVAGFGLIVVLTAPQKVAMMLGQPDLAPWLWLVPVGVLMAASYSALQFWATRARRFGSIAVTRVTQAAAGAGTMLALGWVGAVPFGLLLGNMLNIGAGSLRLSLQALRQDAAKLAQVSCSGLLAVFSRYRRYPLYSTPEALANMAGIQVPVLLVAAFAGAEAGFLLLAQQIMAAPMSLLGSSISQVYVSRAPRELREGQLAEFTAGILHRLMQIGIWPLIFIGIVAPALFRLIFGADWARAGEIVSWMVPWIVLQFLASPISMVMYVADRQRAMLALTLLGGVLRIGALFMALRLGGEALVPAFIGSSAVFYGACLIVFCHVAGIGLRLGEFKIWRYLIFPLAIYGIFQVVYGGYFRA